jgi:hypothetical protein
MRLRYAHLEKEHQTFIHFRFVQPSKHHTFHPSLSLALAKLVLVEAQLCCQFFRDAASSACHHA